MDSDATPKVESEEVEADGYYGDDADTDELDLSFLDEEDEVDGDEKQVKDAEAKPESVK